MQEAQTGSHSIYLLTNYINGQFYCQFTISDDVIQLDDDHSGDNYSIGIEM